MRDNKLPWFDRLLRPVVMFRARYYTAIVLCGLAAAFCLFWPLASPSAPAVLFPVGLGTTVLADAVRRARRRYLAWVAMMMRLYVRPVLRRGRR